MEKKISEIRIGKRHRKDLGDINALAQSISEVGLLHRIVITSTSQLIAGHRRILACKKLGWRKIPVHVVDLKKLVRGELHENIARKNFTPSEAVAIAKIVRPLEEKAARERQGNRTDKHAARLAESARGESREKVASFVGLGRTSLKRAEEIVQAANEDPEKYKPLIDQMDRTGRVNGAHRRLVKMRKAEEINREPPPLPDGPFRVITADPPWPFELRKDDLSRGGIPYPDMTIEKIKQMNVESLAHEDGAILWLWTTNSHLPEAFGVAQAWGFKYKTLLTWVKSKMGTGDWLRGQTEHALMCVKGNATITLSNEKTYIEGKVREHSRKPEEFFKLVESLCPGSKVELFARSERKGWVTHGHETKLFKPEI